MPDFLPRAPKGSPAFRDSAQKLHDLPCALKSSVLLPGAVSLNGIAPAKIAAACVKGACARTREHKPS